jgi:hypothetical protein
LQGLTWSFVELTSYFVHRGRSRRGDANGSSRGTDLWTATMIPLPAGVRVWLATGYADMRKAFRHWPTEEAPGLS